MRSSGETTQRAASQSGVVCRRSADEAVLVETPGEKSRNLIFFTIYVDV